jgi:hypothetical protein
MPLSKIKSTGIEDSSVTSASIADDSIVNADINSSAAIASSKLACGSSFETTTTFNTKIGVVDQNIALLGFKMAVNEGLTVFNLVDGVVDEFHDESGTDEGEGSNDLYCASNDYYINSTSPSGSSVSGSAGFDASGFPEFASITEPDTSTAPDNAPVGAVTAGTFTVPAGVTSINIQAWGAGGGVGNGKPAADTSQGGGGGYAEGTFAVTGSQVLSVRTGEGGSKTSETNAGGGGFRGAGNSTGTHPSYDGSGGGASGVVNAPGPTTGPQTTAPQIAVIAGGGGGGGFVAGCASSYSGGAGGGLIGNAGGSDPNLEQTTLSGAGGGGGSQTAGGTGGASVNPPPDGNPGGFLEGGDGTPDPDGAGGGGEGYYGGGGGGKRAPAPPSDHRLGGGGSSYYGHPQITSGSTEEGSADSGGGTTQPGYFPNTNDGGNRVGTAGAGDGGAVLIVYCAPASTTSTTIVSNAFTASSAPTTSRIVVFQENVASPTLNTDIIASISRDGGSNFTNATLSDSGYVTGSSGQRILTGTATVSGQPSGTSMRWKLALANNAVKIHGVSLQWK